MDIDETARRVHLTAVEHGFWDKERNLGEMLMLVASELAECLEENRAGKPRVYWRCKYCGLEDDVMPSLDDGPHRIPNKGGVLGWIMELLGRQPYCPERNAFKPEGELVEVVDAIIRLFDTGQHMAGMTRYTLAEVMDIKMAYNAGREYMHGKAY